MPQKTKGAKPPETSPAPRNQLTQAVYTAKLISLELSPNKNLMQGLFQYQAQWKKEPDGKTIGCRAQVSYNPDKKGTSNPDSRDPEKEEIYLYILRDLRREPGRILTLCHPLGKGQAETDGSIYSFPQAPNPSLREEFKNSQRYPLNWWNNPAIPPETIAILGYHELLMEKTPAGTRLLEWLAIQDLAKHIPASTLEATSHDPLGEAIQLTYGIIPRPVKKQPLLSATSNHQIDIWRNAWSQNSRALDFIQAPDSKIADLCPKNAPEALELLQELCKPQGKNNKILAKQWKRIWDILFRFETLKVKTPFTKEMIHDLCENKRDMRYQLDPGTLRRCGIDPNHEGVAEAMALYAGHWRIESGGETTAVKRRKEDEWKWFAEQLKPDKSNLGNIASISHKLYDNNQASLKIPEVWVNLPEVTQHELNSMFYSMKSPGATKLPLLYSKETALIGKCLTLLGETEAFPSWIKPNSVNQEEWSTYRNELLENLKTAIAETL